MSRQVISTESAPEAIGPYSQAIRCGSMIFTSGQLPLDPRNGELVGSTAADQAARVLENIRAVMEAAGADIADVVKMTVYVVDLVDFAAINEVYAAFFGDQPPARTTVEVSALPLQALVEMDAVAVVEQ